MRESSDLELESGAAYPPTETESSEAVLFVDDEKNILSSIRRVMRPLKLKTYFAEGGQEGLDILKNNHVDLVVSDMRMPGMDGAEFLARVRNKWPETMRILLTGHSDMSSTIDALNNGGIYRYISKPWEDGELTEIVLDALKLKRLERESAELTALTKQQNAQLQDLNRNLEAKVEARTEEIRQANDKLDLAYNELQENYDSFVQVFSSIINERVLLKRAESQVVADLARKMATALKLKPESVKAVYHAALLHQLGKVSLPDSLLAIPEEDMDEDELERYREYPLRGEASLTAINGLDRTSKFIRHHTELCDGSGYPDGLPKERILSGAKIIRVARDYIGHQTGILSIDKLNGEEAFHKVNTGSGTIYDSLVVKALKHFYKKYDISNLYNDEVKINSYSMRPGMRLTEDLINTKGVVLVAKGHQLTKHVIKKIIELERFEDTRYTIYVSGMNESNEEET